jgi:hypothetical protein
LFQSTSVIVVSFDIWIPTALGTAWTSSGQQKVAPRSTKISHNFLGHAPAPLPQEQHLPVNEETMWQLTVKFVKKTIVASSTYLRRPGGFTATLFARRPFRVELVFNLSISIDSVHW